jgi:elongation factor P
VISASQLRAGMAVRHEGQVYKVLQVESKAGAGQQGGVVKTRMSNLVSGRFWEHNFRPDERLEELEIERQTMEFLYSDNENSFFMNPDNFEQVEIPVTSLGTGARFLKEGVKVPVEFFEGRPISVVFPEFVEARIANTAAPVHAQQDSTWKEATLDNGVLVMVPLFIAPGEIVRVDVQTARYVERVREKKKIA